MINSDGGPAFPHAEVKQDYDRDSGYGGIYTDAVGGMSLRDYFAGQAVVGLANSINALGILDREGVATLGATQAYKWADAMLVARAGADYGSR